jgi:hypothetical protein
MKKLIVFTALFFASFLYAQQAPANGAKYTWFTPCSSWNYSPEGYTCSNLGWQLYIYDTREIDQMIRTLEQRIADLERRVQQLEQNP